MEWSWVKLVNRALPEYRQGVKDFLDFAFEHTTMGNKNFCPCKQCNNYFAKTRDDVEADLLTIGILPNYTCGYFNGGYGSCQYELMELKFSKWRKEIESSTFDKDDQLAKEFVTAVANIRMSSFGISLHSFIEAKGIAADNKLSYALTHCNPRREANIRMILKYLIPVKLSIGILPKDWLLEKYNLVEYKDVVQALRRGDLPLLCRAIQEYEDRFLRSGVFLVLEKLELQVYQRLVKKIYIIQKQKDPTKAHQVKLEVIVKALKWLEMDMDVDEVECIMSILIYKNLVKGYFAHKSKVVVLSKQDQFPKLDGKPVNS